MATELENYFAEQLSDWIDADIPDSAYEEILSDAITIAADEYDCATVDGEWTDLTAYDRIAARATENWEEAMYDALQAKGDYLRDLRDDR